MYRLTWINKQGRLQVMAATSEAQCKIVAEFMQSAYYLIDYVE